MSKIIGVTVGTQLPKPNFKQTDPTKGDYIKNKPEMISDEEFFNWLAEADIIQPVSSTTGELYVNNNNEIYVL